MANEKPKTDFDKLRLVIDIHEAVDENDKGYSHLAHLVGKDPVTVNAHYEGRAVAYKLIREAMQRIERGEWDF